MEYKNEELFEEGLDEEYIEEDEDCITYDFENDINSKKRYEITFIVKSDFVPVFRAIRALQRVLTEKNMKTPNLLELIYCIDNSKKVISKKDIKKVLTENSYHPKKVKKVAKKVLDDLLKDTECNYIPTLYSMWKNQFAVTTIKEVSGNVYCKAAIVESATINEELVNELGALIGTYCERVISVMLLGDNIFNKYTKMGFKFSQNSLEIHSSDKMEFAIRLTDRSKRYMVKAEIMLPEVISKVIKDVEVLDQLVRKIKPESTYGGEYEDTIKDRFVCEYKKLVYEYDFTRTFIEENNYGRRLENLQRYEIDNILSDLEPRVKQAVWGNLNDFIGFEANQKIYETANCLVEAKENQFVDDFKSWKFHGIFERIDRKDLEETFDKVKRNMQLHGVPEQYIDIRISEIQ